MANAVIDADAVKHADADSYDPVTESYDRFVERYSGKYVEHIARLAGLAHGQRVLDVGTGSGIMALHAARCVGDAGRVTGVDLSAGMLALARVKAQRAGVAQCVEFRQMDAERLEVEPGSFDAVVSLFALRHFPDPDAALMQMRRALRAGGRFVAAVGGGAPLFSAAGIAAAPRRILDKFLTLRGRQLRACEFIDGLVRQSLPAGSAESPAGLDHHGLGPAELPQRVAQAGLRVEHVGWLGHRAIVGTPEEFWDLQATFSSMARWRLQDAAPAAVAELKRRFLESCREVQARGGSLVYPTGVVFVAARRP